MADGRGDMRVEDPAMYGRVAFLDLGPWSLVTVTRPNQELQPGQAEKLVTRRNHGPKHQPHLQRQCG